MADGESQQKPDAAKVKTIKIQTGVLKRVAKEKLTYAQQAEKETEKLQKMEADPSKCEHDIKLMRNCRDESTNMIKVVGRNLTQAHEKLMGIMKEVEDDALIKETEEYKKMLEVLDEAKTALALEPY